MATVYNPANDPYTRGGEATPNRTSVAITPSDTIDLNPYPKNVTILTAGSVVCLPLKGIDGTFVTFGAVLAGFTLPFRVRRILATGTTASLVALND
jgi:hypothetical protein